MEAAAERARAATRFDAAMFVLGACFGLTAVGAWLTQPALSAQLAGAAALVVVMSRFPLVHRRPAGDVVVGFEACALVFLALTSRSATALALWTVGTAAAHLATRKSLRTRLFNTGVTVLAGGAAIAVIHAAGPSWRHGDLVALGLVAGGCAAYFALDLAATGISLSLEAGAPLRDAFPGRTVLVASMCFLGVDTVGYLAAILERSEPRWTLLLVLVPIGTILAAARAYSRAQEHQNRSSALFAAAMAAANWHTETEVEAALTDHAVRVLPRAVAELRTEPPGPAEIGATFDVEGRPTRYLVARRRPGASFRADEERALVALTAVAGQAAARTRLLAEAAHRARHDPLTGLVNRTVLTDRLAHALALCRRGQRLVAVLYCDLDGFKLINDELGHADGDRILASVADRFRAALRPSDTVARVGGDEFAVLLEDVTGPGEALTVGQRLVAALRTPFVLRDRELTVGLSIGVMVTGSGELSVDAVLRNADLAMYRAKALGRDRVELFHPRLTGTGARRTDLGEDLQRALAAGDVSVHYQPVVDLQTGAVPAVEALARWTHPSLGPIPPDVFVAVAEKCGLIGELGSVVLDQSYRAGTTLAAAAGRPIRVAVNVSPRQIVQHRVVDRIAQLVAQHPDVPLALELTEGTLLSDDGETVTALNRLRDLGVRLAVDDFGVGYSSIAYLQRFPIDTIKIDRSFVAELTTSTKAQTLTQAVMGIAAALDLTVVAEGVEDWATVALLRSMRCPLAQGHLFSPAVPLDEAIRVARAGAVDLAPATAISWVPAPRRPEPLRRIRAGSD